MFKIAVIGECMIELYEEQKTLYKQTFGGDTFNCAVYLKRSLENAHIEYITVLGKDDLSNKMIDFFRSEDIKTTFVDKLENRFPGLYMIHVENGERSFSYWRDSSAAKELFLTNSLERLSKELLDYDLIYFSAITLAIMSKKGRENLYTIIKEARNNGVKVAFDSNYRSNLYKNIYEAKELYKEALRNCDIFLPSIDDEKNLWGDLNADEIIKNSQIVGVKEVVVKCGEDDIIYYSNNQKGCVKIDKLKKIIDTTAAGDSFNGSFLVARLKNIGMEESIKLASKLASKVIMYKGAIIPKEV